MRVLIILLCTIKNCLHNVILKKAQVTNFPSDLQQDSELQNVIILLLNPPVCS